MTVSTHRPRRLTRAAGIAAVSATLVAAATSALLPAEAPTASAEAAAPAAPAPAPNLSSLQAQLSSAMGTPSPLDEYGRPTPQTAQRVRDFANQPWLPADARNAVLSALAFYTGEGGGKPGANLVEGGPGITQFYWPTVSGRCIGGQQDSVGSAIAVPGPTQIPAPGAGPDEAVFLFTALGTDSAAKEQGKMQVQWFNIDNFTSGSTPLFNNGINQDGPTTVSGRAHTGKGTVLALLSGTVNTQSSSCSFLPTAAIIEVK